MALGEEKAARLKKVGPPPVRGCSRLLTLLAGLPFLGDLEPLFSVYESEGWEFESLRARHFSQSYSLPSLGRGPRSGSPETFCRYHYGQTAIDTGVPSER